MQWKIKAVDANGEERTQAVALSEREGMARLKFLVKKTRGTQTLVLRTPDGQRAAQYTVR